MKKLIVFSLLILMFLGIKAQTFTGTLTIGDYARKNTKATLTIKDNVATAVLYNVKFSRLMPFAVDATIPNLTVSKKDGKIIVTGNNITPTVKGKGYGKFMIKNFHGTIDGENVNASTLMGDEKVTYVGKTKK